jgi:hypothetical protein
MKKLTKEQKRDIAAVAAKTDAESDLTDIPEVLDWRGAEIGLLYRPERTASHTPAAARSSTRS